MSVKWCKGCETLLLCTLQDLKSTHSFHCWVTYVTGDDMVRSALVLAKSLRLRQTNKRIAVIITANISQREALFLRNFYDDVHYLDHNLVPEGLGNDEIRAKIFAFSLEIYKKCIFLEPSTVFLENNDALFSQICSYNSNNKLQAFLFTPTLSVCTYLVNQHTEFGLASGLYGKDRGDFKQCIESWLTNNCKVQNPTTVVQDLSFAKFSLDTGELMNNTMASSTRIETIFELVDLPSCGNDIVGRMKFLEKTMSLGLIEKALVQEWFYIDENLSETAEFPRCDLNLGMKYLENEPIAIIGISCRFPGANNLDEFRAMLFDGKEGITEPPTFRWMKEQSIYGGSGKERKTNAGFLTCPVDDFDAKFFGISPKDAVLLDPQARLLHEVLWESLEDCGIDPLSLYGSHTGIFTGSWMYDYKDIIQESPEKDFFRSYMGNSIGATAARLSFILGLTGPSIATESGCSSSIVALDLAVKSLRNNESNLAIAGGVNLLLHPFQSNIIDYVIAPDGRCKTFDAKADGFGRAEGCGVLVLKRLSDALQDRDHIWALIRGSAISQEGLSRSLGTPTAHCEALAMQLALQDAGVLPEQVTYVETHGTGTRVGDPMEVAAIAKAYHSKNRKEPLILGSVKTNVGHTESCSGITGIIKTVIAMHQELIPKHLNFDTLNPNVHLDSIPGKIPTSPIPWRKNHGNPRLAGVSSFGITGTDGHVILQEPPEILPPKLNLGLKRPLHLIKFSAKTTTALRKIIDVHAELFIKKQDTSEGTFEDVAYTLNIGRANFLHRNYILARNYEDAAVILSKSVVVENESPDKVGKICFLFSGQGSQYEGMAKCLYETSPVFRLHFDFCENYLKNYNISLRSVIWNIENSKQLHRTIYSQTSIFCVQFCLLKLWESWGIYPDIVLGHSLGEFCAAVAAGILQLKDALKLVVERSILIDSLQNGSMLVVKTCSQHVNDLLRDSNIHLDIAAVNSDQQTVVAGDTENIIKFSDICKKSDIKATVLDSTHAFHSSHMDAILKNYKIIAKDINSQQGKKCEYISAVEGKLIENPETDINPDYWIRHTREKVLFLTACKAIKELNCNIFVEIGPQPILSSIVMQNINDVSISCYPSLRRKANDWDTILNSLGSLYLKGYKVDWEGYDRPYLRKKIPGLPFYPFNRKSFWVSCKQRIDAAIHPLLGHLLENAASDNIFQNDLSLQDVPYMRDHVLGNTVLFPGAGFTEMCLAAGYCVSNMLTESLDKPTRPIALENVKIEAPLELTEGKFCRLQTIVSLPESCNATSVPGLDCKIYHQNENNEMDIRGKRSWVLHASAIFHPLLNTNDLLRKWKPDRILEMITNQEPIKMDKFYKTVNSAGFMFQDHFRTLQRHWFIPEENGACEIVAEMNVPFDHNKYILHPLVIDGMILTVLLSLWRSQAGSLRVPVRIGKLTLINNIKEHDSKLFLHCKWENGDHHSVYLSTNNMTLIAVLQDIAFIETNVKTVLSVLEQQNSKIPDSWEEIWRPTPLKQNISNEPSELQAHSAAIELDESKVNDLYPSTKREDINERESFTHETWIWFLPETNSFLHEVANALAAKGTTMTKVLSSSSPENNSEEIESALKQHTGNLNGILFAWGINEGVDDQHYIALPFLQIVKHITNLKNSPKLFVLTKGVHAITQEAHVNFSPSAATLIGMAKSLKNEKSDLLVRCIDIEDMKNSDLLTIQIMSELGFGELADTQDTKSTVVAYRDGIRYEPKFIKSTVPQNPSRLDLILPPNSERFQLVLPRSKIINDLKFDILEEKPVGENEVEMRTRAYGLNFRDLFSILKPTKELEILNAIGLDIAGIITKVGSKVAKHEFKVGDRIFAANFEDIQLPSHVVVRTDLIHCIPSNMSFSEAATLPLAFSTAYHCLVNVANIKKGETVLIHTGTGGVGQASIQIAIILEQKLSLLLAAQENVHT